MEKKISIDYALKMAKLIKDCLPDESKLKLVINRKEDYEKELGISEPDDVVANYGNVDDEFFIIAKFKFTNDEEKNYDVMGHLIQFVNRYSMEFKTKYQIKREKKVKSIYSDWKVLTSNVKNSNTEIVKYLAKKYGYRTTKSIYNIINQQRNESNN